jgi:FtsH-binding integral membrane protein
MNDKAIYGWLALLLVASGTALAITLNVAFSFPTKELNPLSFEIFLVGIACFFLALLFASAWRQSKHQTALS